MAATTLFGAGFRRNNADSTHGETGGVLEIVLPGEGTNTHSRQLHLVQGGDHDLDLNIAAQANPTFYVHSVTTPITDYVSIGGHDGTTATIDVVGGTTLSFAVGGTSSVTMTAGLMALNQGALDTAHFALRSSDVVTGMTTINLGPAVGTNDYFSIGKIAGATGGAYITSIAETAVAVGMHFEAWSGQPATTDTDTSLGVMNFHVGIHDDANGDSDIAANGNGFVWGEITSGNARVTRMLMKADDGEIHIGNTTGSPLLLDSEDDMLMIRQLQKGSGLMDGIVHSVYDEDRDNPFYDHAKMTELGIVDPKNEDGFYLSRLQPTLRLHEGAMWQTHNDLMGIASVLSPAQRKKLPDRVQKRLALAGA
jgi:hypothetical protein